jgi:hypothetical protein
VGRAAARKVKRVVRRMRACILSGRLEGGLGECV